MESEKQLKNEKLASLILLQKYIEENEQEKAYLLALRIEELNAELEKNSDNTKVR